MAAFDLFGGLSVGGFWGIVTIIFWATMIGVPVLVILFFFFRWIYKKKVWNLDVEFKLPRSDGKFMNAEWGIGSYNIKRGVCYVKRKKKRKVPMKPFDINKYLQGTKTLTVVQVGAENYLPVLPESWEEMINEEPLRDKDGNIREDEEGNPIYEKVALIDIKINTLKDKAWKDSFEREAKMAYSIMSLLREYAIYLGIGILLLCNFVGFAILWAKIT